MAFSNVWLDDIPIASAQASLGYLNMQQIRVDVEQRLAQGLCGTAANLPAALEAQFTTGAGAGMPYYAYDQHKVYQLVAGSAYAEVATLSHYILDTAVNTFVNPGGSVTLNSITIPAGFLGTPPYYIEIEAYLNLTVFGSFPVAMLNFGGTTIITDNFVAASPGPIAFIARVYVTALNTETFWGNINLGAGNVLGTPSPATEPTAGEVVITTKFTGTTSTVKGGWLMVKILK